MVSHILLNGRSIVPDEKADTIAALLAARSIDPAHVVVEVNREIINRDHFAVTALRDGDVIEILRFVGGG